MGEAWQAINKKHPSLPVAIFTSDAGEWFPLPALALSSLWVLSRGV